MKNLNYLWLIITCPSFVEFYLLLLCRLVALRGKTLKSFRVAVGDSGLPHLVPDNGTASHRCLLKFLMDIFCQDEEVPFCN